MINKLFEVLPHYDRTQRALMWMIAMVLMVVLVELAIYYFDVRAQIRKYDKARGYDDIDEILDD